MSQYKLKDISHIINAKKSVSDDRHISYILTDSRRLTVPGKTLFFAIRGERHDGHDYIKQLYDKGVRSFVIDKKPENFSLFLRYLIHSNPK